MRTAFETFKCGPFFLGLTMKRVFYIEKEEFLRKSIEICFENDCFCVSSANDCFHFILDLNPGVIVIDYESVDKEDFFEMIKQNPQTSSTPIVLTGKDADAPLLGLNIRKYFQKPFSPKELENSLREIIGDK